MRNQARNKQTFYYAKYLGIENIIDDEGNYTGEYAVSYSNPIKVKGNISGNRGETEYSSFGVSENFDRVISLDKEYRDIDIHSKLWIDILPIIQEDGSTNTAHDYIVTKNSSTINEYLIAIKKVDVKYED